ncbi:MAG: tetratricopeptide repeat protein, partial [Deltaproteobacteria bacterium]|nr:tetratricopeptide repeat protein [Kofleriaceae bacterium]
MASMDARGNPVSTDDKAALDALEVALLQYQSYVGDALGTIDGALARRPDFVMGQIFRTGLLATFAEARFTELARESQAAAEQLASAANDRERALMAATRELVAGDWDAGCAALERVLVEHPRDAFAVQTAHLFDFLRGDAKNLRDRITRVLPAWSADVPGYSYILGMHAFGLEECNQYAEARATAERALAIEPRDGWAVHAAVHCCEMQGQVDEGVTFLESRRDDWAVDNGFAFHNWWHLALFHLDRGDTAKVLALFDEVVFPEPGTDVAYQLLDATSLLWRLYLAGTDVRARAARVAEVWAAKSTEPGFYAFNDVHALLAFVMAERTADIPAWLVALERAAGDGRSAGAIGSP